MTFTPPDTLLDNLKDVAVPQGEAPRSVFDERDLYKKQRDDAWKEVEKLEWEIKKLRSMAAHYPKPPIRDVEPSQTMPERKE